MPLPGRLPELGLVLRGHVLSGVAALGAVDGGQLEHDALPRPSAGGERGPCPVSPLGGARVRRRGLRGQGRKQRIFGEANPKGEDVLRPLPAEGRPITLSPREPGSTATSAGGLGPPAALSRAPEPRRAPATAEPSSARCSSASLDCGPGQHERDGAQAPALAPAPVAARAPPLASVPRCRGSRPHLRGGIRRRSRRLSDRRQQKVSGRNSTPRSHTPLNATKPTDEQWIRHSAPTQATADPRSHRRGHWFDPSIAHQHKRPHPILEGGV